MKQMSEFNIFCRLSGHLMTPTINLIKFASDLYQLLLRRTDFWHWAVRTSQW